MSSIVHDPGPLLQPPWLHLETGAVRFEVALPDGTPFGAILSKEVLRYRYLARADGGDAVALYQSNRLAIDAAVCRRVLAGSREPVILREHDLAGAPPTH